MNSQFSPENIQHIFGHEAAEDESVERLREYYFKTKVFDSIRANLPLRILVGHKGMGKSALFKVAIEEEKAEGQLPILLRPNDVVGIDPEAGFLNRIKDWKYGLQAIIAQKSFDTFGIKQDGKLGDALHAAGKTLGFIRDTIRPYTESKVDLSPTEKALITKFLRKSSITVYLDDLDRGWRGRPEDIQSLSALVNALRDLSSENVGLQFKLSLRSDVYYLLRTSDESTDKLEGSVVWFAWTNHEILALLAKRIETFYGREVDEDKLRRMAQPEVAKFLIPVMTSTYRGVGKWHDVPIYKVLMSLIRRRPRDLVKLCSLAANHAHDNNRDVIISEDVRAILEEYSQGRLQDTINEFRSEMAEVERLILNMKPNRLERQASAGYSYTTEQLLIKLKNIASQGSFSLAGKGNASPKELAQFLYKITFLTARKRAADGRLDRKYFEESRYVSSQFADFGYDWEVHPAYRWALQPEDIENVFQQLEVGDS